MKPKPHPEARLTHLENNEAVLLMYLAGELPKVDHAEITALIAKDAGMRRQLEEIRVAQDISFGAIAAGDRVAHLPSAFAAARAFGSAMRTRPAEEPVEPEPLMITRYRWALYPAAAVALLAIGMAAWFQNARSELDRPIIAVGTNAYPNAPRRQLEAWDPFYASPMVSATENELDMLSSLREDTLR